MTGRAMRTTTAFGRATVDPESCTGCRACVASCPRKAIEVPQEYCCAKCVKYCLGMDVPCRPVALVVQERCDGCGACLEGCPSGAIRIVEPAARAVDRG